MSKPERVFLALGSNLGNRKKNIENAISMLNLGDVIVSNIYDTQALITQEAPQEWRDMQYLNAVVSGFTNRNPMELLSYIKQIEINLGRKQRAKWAPREIDIDILIYSDIVFNEQHLEIPHAEMHRRDFVLKPLVEIAPDLIHPKFGVSMRDLLKELPGNDN